MPCGAVPCPAVRCCFFPLANYNHTADQNVTSPTSTQHSTQHRPTISNSAQEALGIIYSLVAPNHGPLLSAPFTHMFQSHSSLRERNGRRQPPTDRSTCTITKNINLLRGPERPSFLSHFALTLRHCPLRTSERARMPETALLSACIYIFQIQVLGEVEIFASLYLKLLFFWNTTYYLDTAPFRYLRNGPAFFFFF